ncbi:MAG TPA: ester cyclase [Thermoplasmata archaeon]|nr:ester cyclase [Thermoplasmata archaeon]
MGVDRDTLAAAQRRMLAVWGQHVAAEFERHDVDETMTTMTPDTHNMNLAVLTGGVGADGVRAFYREYFLPSLPPDNEIVLVSRTIGVDRIVDEIVHKFTHSKEMPWILPGIRPTGRRVELPVVAVVEFKGGKIHSEHIYWDQASLLVQVGLLKPEGLPVVAAGESARHLVNPKLPLNDLIRRAGRRR